MLSSLIEPNHLVFVLLFLLALWLVITTVLSLVSGWFRLMAKYPDQDVEPLLRIRGQSGTMGPGVGMRGILTLTACPTGLRVGIMRVFGPFCRDFFVPWACIVPTEKTKLFWPSTTLMFGKPTDGTLSISADTADRLALASRGRWPKPVPLPAETRGDVGRRLLAQWAAATACVALFFTFVPVVLMPNAPHPSVLVSVLLPALVFGVASIVSFLRTKS